MKRLARRPITPPTPIAWLAGSGVGAPLILPSRVPVPGGGPLLVSAPPGTEPTVADLLGACPTAGYAAEIYVAATMTNGIGRQSQCDAAALMGFVLTK